MSLHLENSTHFQDLQSVLTSWNTQCDQHDLLLICKSGHRLSTRQSLLSLHSPLIRTLLDNIPPSSVLPAISVSADVMAVGGLVSLLSTGITLSGRRNELEEVEKVAMSLGVPLANCKMEDNNYKRKLLVGSGNNISISTMIVNTPLVVEESVETNCASIEIGSLKKRGIISFTTSIFKKTEVKGMSKDNESLSVLKKIPSNIEKVKKKTYRCVDCKKQLSTKRNLKTNRIKFHTDPNWAEQIFKCSICDKQFALKRCMKIHKIESHYGLLPEDLKFAQTHINKL